MRATLIALTFGILSLVPLASGQEKKPKGDPNQPAGEAFKNVQILKTVPRGQFIQFIQAFI